MIWIIGIDPGINGALSVVDESQELIMVCDLPTEFYKAKKRRINAQALVEIVNEIKRQAEDTNITVRCYVEQISARPHQGVVSMFNFGETQGVIRGVLLALGVPYYTVSPQKWKRFFNLATGDKKVSLVRVRERYPEAGLNLAKDIDKADAIHLALYGVLQHSVQTNCGGAA